MRLTARFLMVLLAPMAFGTVHAQTMQVWKGGQQTTVSLKGTQRLTFSLAYPRQQGVAYVDLGLPSGTLWAVANTDASSLEQSGTSCAAAGAAAKTSGSWLMPSLAQAQELIGQCERKAVKMNGVAGVLLTGPNGRTLFFPSAVWISGTTQQLVPKDGELTILEATAPASVRLAMQPLSGSIEDPSDGGSYDL